MIKKKTIKTIIALMIAMPLTTHLAFAHGGRTDSAGGHRDNKNKSGLGSYHYHCGGYSAHLHNNGVCPYKSGSSSSSSSSSTTSQNNVIIAAKKEATNTGYDAGYSAGTKGEQFDDSNSSTYSTEYERGYKDGYEKGKIELETNIKNAYDEGYAAGYKCEVENNSYTVQGVKDSYSKGYNEGVRVYVEENTNKFISYGEEDACSFTIRSFEDNIPSDLKTTYINAYNNKIAELKKIAFDTGYVQAISNSASDSSIFSNEEEVAAHNEGYNAGVSDLEAEKSIAYEYAYTGLDYILPEKFSEVEELIMSSYNEGLEVLKAEKERKVKISIGIALVLLVSGSAGGIVIMKKRKVSNKESLDLYKNEDKVSY